jgi:hypothetical protein
MGDESPRIFLAIYTFDKKSYCDEEFFGKIKALTYTNKEIHVVDNSTTGGYTTRLAELLDGTDSEISHLDIVVPPGCSKTHEHITQSANLLRDKFLGGGCDYFFTVESDVFLPSNAIEALLEKVGSYDIFGGLYYEGRYPKEWYEEEHSEIEEMSHVLSGCTLYSRRSIEQVAFRYDPTFLVGYPDAFISHDIFGLGYKCAMYTGVKCEHKRGGW